MKWHGRGGWQHSLIETKWAAHRFWRGSPPLRPGDEKKINKKKFEIKKRKLIIRNFFFIFFLSSKFKYNLFWTRTGARAHYPDGARHFGIIICDVHLCVAQVSREYPAARRDSTCFHEKNKIVNSITFSTKNRHQVGNLWSVFFSRFI